MGKAGVKASKSTKVSETGADLVKSVPDVFKAFLEGRSHYNTLWTDEVPKQFQRGRIIESGLFRHLHETNPNLHHLDPIPGLGNFPAIDYYDPVMRLVISAKSIYTPGKRYTSITTFRNTLDKYAGQVQMFEFSRLADSRKQTLEREIKGYSEEIDSRRLALVIPEGVSQSKAHGRELLDFVCTQRRAGLEVIVHYTKSNKANPFDRWPPPPSCGSS